MSPLAEQDDSPEHARVHEEQMMLLPLTASDVCDLLGLDWWAALKLGEDGWLSFKPDKETPLSDAQAIELDFVGQLVAAGCDPAMLGRLLCDLKKPYQYRADLLFYDWDVKSWSMLPKLASSEEEIVRDWMTGLEETKDREELESFIEEAEAAIERIEEREAEEREEKHRNQGGIVVYVNAAEFLSFGRALKGGWKASRIGYITMDVRDGKMHLSCDKAGCELVCTGKTAVCAHVAVGSFWRMIATHKRSVDQADQLKLVFRPEFGEVAMEHGSAKARFGP